MPIRKKGNIDIRTSANGAKVKRTGYTFYSYDKKSAALYFQFRGQDGQPTDLGKATIHLVMILNDDGGKEFIPKSDEIEVISAIRGTAKYVLPEMLLSYSGEVTGYVYMDFDDGSQSDDGQFTFRIRRSMITHVLPAMGDKYVQDFEDITERVKQAEDKAKNDMQESVDQVNKDYEAWKAEQKKENEDFQNEYKQQWQNFKNTQNKNRTDFEDDFQNWEETQGNKQKQFESDFKKWKDTQGNKQKQFESDFQNWKDTQVNKQTEFEDSTNEQLKGITEDVNNAEDKVADLEKNLDVEQKNYFSVEAWKERASTAVITNDLPAIKLKLEGNTQYTLSTNIPVYDDSTGSKAVFFATSDVGRVHSANDGVSVNDPRTITTNEDGEVVVVIREKYMTSGDWWVMLNKGSTAYEWVPNANDIVTKSELDKKLDVDLSGYATEDYVNQAINEEAPDLSDYAKKQDVNTLKERLPKFENEELIMSGDFENAFPDKKSTKLQYVLQGNMMQIFGLIRTKKELKGKDTHVIGRIPDKFNPIIEGYNYGTMGSRYHFKTYINDQNDPSYPNKVTIRRITDVDNQYVDISADEKGVFHISLTIGVELNG